jgi:phage baseplate assembly protein W
MGKIILNRLPQKSNVGKSYLYADLHLDLQESYNISSNLFQKPEINDFKIDYDIDAIKNSLYNLFTTTPGEKILNPEYGLDFKQYLFLPATVDIAKYIRDEIYSQVARYEPRVKIVNVNITILEDVNEFDINIYYNVSSLNIHNISMFGTLSRNGYIFRN